MTTRFRHVISRLGVVLLAVSVGAGCSYNRFTASEEAIKGAWGQVENQLQRRHDLIPNLVETARAYAQQERDVFGQIAEARAKMAGAKTPAEKIAAANAETSALGRLFVVVEAYPTLKSDATFQTLMTQLEGTENRLATERMRYNERIQEYNTLRRRFPSNVTAKIFGFGEYPYYEAPADAKAAPKVDFRQGGGS